MGRVLMYTVLALLAVFVLTSYFLLEHGGRRDTRTVQDVTVHDLTSPRATYRRRGR